MSIKSIIMSVIGVVIAVSLTPTIWTSIYTTAVGAGVNGTTMTLLTLVPFVYIGVIVIGGIVYAIKG